VLQGLLTDTPDDVEIVALSGTSGGAICATIAWDGFLRGDKKHAASQLESFWQTMAAQEPWDQLVNQALASVIRMREISVLPEVSPYHMPTWAEERFRATLCKHLDFEELRRLARLPDALGLRIGAVEVLTGKFEVFTGDEICVECLLASAAIPELFRAIPVPGRGLFWDGLFSQNPPIRDLLKYRPDEIWVIQINPVTRAHVPTETHEILDRRNGLAGNLSLMQELVFIDAINRAIERGVLNDPRYQVIHVERIYLDRELHYRTKMDRHPDFLRDLMDYGQTKWRTFARDRREQPQLVDQLV
jgi:NTE family protein